MARHGKVSPPRRRSSGFRFESLEARQLFATDGLAALCQSDAELQPEILPAILGESTEPAAPAAASATHPLSDVPVLNSLPGAAASLYLDFNGHTQVSWGSYSNINSPAYDRDGDRTTFSDSELGSIQQIWAQVAEDYAPFKINVTTVEPASFANKVALRVVVGGDSSWLGSPAGGVAYINSFTNSLPNVAYVFPSNLGNGNPRYVGEASSHEAGHAFGLSHQSAYNDDGELAAEYYAGPGDGRAPIMGVSYYATRGLWWSGTTSTAQTFQDDMSLISRTANAFGYRADDNGNTIATATELDASGSELSAAGIIERSTDVDYFSFTTAAGQVGIDVQVPTGINNLDSQIQLFTSAGSLIAAASPVTSFNSSIVTSLAAGAYYIAVAGSGGYGDVGQYSINVNTVPPQTIMLGDLNDDGIVDNIDIQPFEIALADPALYEALNPTITDYAQRGDINGDGQFNNLDLGPFEHLLTGRAISTSSLAAVAPSTPADSASGLASSAAVTGDLAASTVVASPLRNADGLFVMRPVAGKIQLPAALLNDPRITGFVLRDDWQDVNPAPGVYNWSRLDAAVSAIVAAGKTFKLNIEAGVSAPAWLYAQGAKAMTFTEKAGSFRPNGTFTMPVPWDGVMLAAYDDLLREMDRHFGANPNLVMVGLAGPTQFSLEMHLPSEVRSLPDFSLDKIRSAWDHVLQTYSGLFPNVRGGLQLANPFHASDGLALQIAQDAISILGPRVALQHNALSAKVAGYNIHQIVSQYGQAGAYTGFEELTSSNQTRFGGSFATAWQRVLEGKARYLDFYIADLANLKSIPSAIVSPWKNQANPFDVNGDGLETPLDLLLLSTELAKGTQLLPKLASGQQPKSYYDVDGDNFLSRYDVDLLLAHLNAQAAASQAATSSSLKTSVL